MKNVFALLAFCLFAFPLFAADKKADVTLTLGAENAPVVIDEYASLGCSHCADFHLNALPQVKRDFVDTGRVKIIFHHFPLDKASVDAAVLVQCAPTAQRWSLVELLYQDQNNWARDPKYREKLAGYGAMLGMKDETIQSCLKSTQRRDDILRARVEAHKKLQIESTPTFMINGTARLKGSQTYQQIASIINNM